jgi:hypothetical protein
MGAIIACASKSDQGSIRDRNGLQAGPLPKHGFAQDCRLSSSRTRRRDTNLLRHSLGTDERDTSASAVSYTVDNVSRGKERYSIDGLDARYDALQSRPYKTAEDSR